MSRLDPLCADDCPGCERSEVASLRTAVEAVLELRPIANDYRMLDDWESGYNQALHQLKHKIRIALGNADIRTESGEPK